MCGSTLATRPSETLFYAPTHWLCCTRIIMPLYKIFPDTHNPPNWRCPFVCANLSPCCLLRFQEELEAKHIKVSWLYVGIVFALARGWSSEQRNSQQCLIKLFIRITEHKNIPAMESVP